MRNACLLRSQTAPTKPFFPPMEKCVTRIKRPALFKLSSPQSPLPAYSPNRLSRTRLFSKRTTLLRSNIIVFKTLARLVKRLFFQCDAQLFLYVLQRCPLIPFTDFFPLTIRFSRKRGRRTASEEKTLLETNALTRYN